MHRYISVLVDSIISHYRHYLQKENHRWSTDRKRMVCWLRNRSKKRPTGSTPSTFPCHPKSTLWKQKNRNNLRALMKQRFLIECAIKSSTFIHLDMFYLRCTVRPRYFTSVGGDKLWRHPLWSLHTTGIAQRYSIFWHNRVLIAWNKNRGDKTREEDGPTRSPRPDQSLPIAAGVSVDAPVAVPLALDATATPTCTCSRRLHHRYSLKEQENTNFLQWTRLLLWLLINEKLTGWSGG